MSCLLSNIDSAGSTNASLVIIVRPDICDLERAPMSIFDQFPTPPCAKTLGWTLIKADENSGTVQVGFEGSAAFCNPGGNIQGGFIAAMLDDTLGPTAASRLNLGSNSPISRSP